MPPKKIAKKNTTTTKKKTAAQMSVKKSSPSVPATSAKPMPGILFNELRFKTETDTPNATSILPTDITPETAEVTARRPEDITAAQVVSKVSDEQFAHWQREQRAARRWLYVGVGSIAVMIVTLWSITLRARFNTITKASTSPGLLEASKQNWQAIFDTTNTPIIAPNQTTTVQEQIKNALTNFAAQKSATSTASSTFSKNHTSTQP